MNHGWAANAIGRIEEWCVVVFVAESGEGDAKREIVIKLINKYVDLVIQPLALS